jgi:hypothetical protein
MTASVARMGIARRATQSATRMGINTVTESAAQIVIVVERI